MLRQLIKYFVFLFLKIFGVYSYYRYINKNKSIVLTYHGVVPEIHSIDENFEYRNFVSTKQFEKQIKLLLKYYRPLSINDFLNATLTNDKGFFITFDDGFRNNYQYAFPVLKKYNLQACFFITTNYIDNQGFLWTEEIGRLIKNTKKLELTLNFGSTIKYQLNDKTDRDKISSEIRKHLKKLSISERDNQLREIRKQLSDANTALEKHEEERYLFMSWNEIVEMADNNQIIGSHTHTHPILSRLDKSDSYTELKTSKELIEDRTGKPCLMLSYPNGTKEDYTEIQKNQLKNLNYKAAFTQISSFYCDKSDQYEIGRFNITGKMLLPVFEAKISGFFK